MFSDRLKLSRQKSGFTQQQAAETLNLSVRSYQRYEAKNGAFEPSQIGRASCRERVSASV